jgi:hypothetical protein
MLEVLATARRDYLGTSDLGSPRSEIGNATYGYVFMQFPSISVFIFPRPVLPL